MEKKPAVARKRENLTPLTDGADKDGDAGSELLSFTAQLFIEDALEGRRRRILAEP